MKLFFFSLFAMAVTGFAENLVLDNQTYYPNKAQKSKIAVQWATSAREVQEGNDAILYGKKLSANTFQVLHKSGEINLSIPRKAEYFRVIAWSKGEGNPDYITNWIEIEPNKTYTLEADHLVPSVLIAGTGC